MNSLLPINDKKQTITFSLLCPTRDRKEGVGRLIQSLCDHTHDFKTIELLFRIDDDDFSTKEYFKQLDYTKIPFPIRLYSLPRSPFLQQDYYNYLAIKANGQFVWAVGDDTELKTKNWDRTLRNEVENYYINHPTIKDKILFISIDDSTPRPKNIDCTLFCCFPIVSKESTDVLGFLFHRDIMTWGADYTIYHVYSHPDIDRVLSVPGVGLWHHSHHNQTIPQDQLNKDVQARWRINSYMCDIVKSSFVPRDVRRLSHHIRKIEHREERFFMNTFLFEPLRFFITGAYQISFGFYKEGRHNLVNSFTKSLFFLPAGILLLLFSLLPQPFYKLFFLCSMIILSYLFKFFVYPTTFIQKWILRWRN